jgi:hypothetical protein
MQDVKYGNMDRKENFHFYLFNKFFRFPPMTKLIEWIKCFYMLMQISKRMLRNNKRKHESGS